MYEALVVKLDLNGKVLWQKKYGEGLAINDDAAPRLLDTWTPRGFYGVDQTDDGGFVFAGDSLDDNAYAARVKADGLIVDCANYVKNSAAKTFTSKLTVGASIAAKESTTVFTAKPSKLKATNATVPITTVCGGTESVR